MLLLGFKKLKKKNRPSRTFPPSSRYTPDFKIIIVAKLAVSLQAKVCNIQLHLLSIWDRYNPCAVLVVGVVIGIVWRLQCALSGIVCSATHCNTKTYIIYILILC